MENTQYINSRKQVSEAQENSIGSSLLDKEVLSADDVLLVPQHGILDSRLDAIIEPFIFSSPMDTVTGYELTKEMVANNHYAVACRFAYKEWMQTFKDFYSNDMVFFAVGSDTNDPFFIENLLHTIGCDQKETAFVNISIDVAHGDTKRMLALYKAYRARPWVNKLMSGSIATAEAAERAIYAGCDHIRIGVGPGSACTTRLMTGCGMPLLTSVYNIHKHLLSISSDIRASTHLIADGGIKYPGDAVKYLAAGADSIMMGKNFSHCVESPGWEKHRVSWFKPPILVKSYRGQASRSFQVDILGKDPHCPEGAAGPRITPTRTVKQVIDEYEGGLRSALSYLGLTSSAELSPERTTFIKNTVAAQIEGSPHGT